MSQEQLEGPEAVRLCHGGRETKAGPYRRRNLHHIKVDMAGDLRQG